MKDHTLEAPVATWTTKGMGGGAARYVGEFSKGIHGAERPEMRSHQKRGGPRAIFGWVWQSLQGTGMKRKVNRI